MRILLDCRFQKGAGPNVTTRYLLDYMLQHNTNHEFVILQHQGQPLPDYPGVVKITVPARNPLLEFLWVQVYLPRILQQYKIDMCHSLKHVGPLFTSVPTILHVREVGHFLPEGQEAFRFNLASKLYWNHILVWGVKRATHVVAISEECKDGLIAKCGVSDRKITVNYHGVDKKFRPIDDAAAIAARRRRYSLPEQYILCVSSPYPHKNYDTVIKMFAKLREQKLDTPKLVIVGNLRYARPDFFELIDQLGVKEDIIFPGYIEHDDLVYVYNGAKLLLYAPMLGSFGNPPVEAMASGTPVIVSDRGALSEVTGGAAIVLQHPRDVDAMLHAVQHILADDQFRQTMRSKGLQRAQLFTWEASATGMLATYDMIARRLQSQRVVAPQS